MSQGKKRKYGLSDFFSEYLGNFGKLLLTNLLFCIPLAVCSVILGILFSVWGGLNIFVMFLPIILLSSFYGGVVYLCKKVTVREEINLISDFKKGIKDNWKFFSVSSIFAYIITTGLWVTLSYFREHLDNPIVVLYLVFSLLTGLFFLFMGFSLIAMSVSADLKPNEMLKNSVMLVAGGIAQHLKTLLSLIFLSAVIFSILVFIDNAVVLISISVLLILLILPTLTTYIIIYNSYQTIERVILKPYEKDKREQEKKAKETEESPITEEELEMLSKGAPDEYVYLNGRMVKRRTILKMLERMKSSK